MKLLNFFSKKTRTMNACLILFTALLFISCNESEPLTENVTILKKSNSLALHKTTSTFGLIGNGVNLQPSYYNNGNCDLGWTLMKQNTKIQTVRIEVEPGQVVNAKRWISEAKSNGYKVIITYHKSSVLGSDSTSELLAAYLVEK